MITIGIDTSAVTCSVALAENGKILYLNSQSNGLTHSQTLLPSVIASLETAGKTMEDVSLISVAAGPGSFTGLRIGISTVKGLCVSRNIPVASVSTLEGLATNFRESEGITVHALMDARRGEFYYARFRIVNHQAERLCEDCAATAENIASQICPENTVLVGDGALKFTSIYPQFSPLLAKEEFRLQSGASIALLGERAFLKGETMDCRKLSPHYLRLPQAEREWQAKQNQK